jgi:hypothetical protein
MKLTPDHCPKCGEPARNAKATMLCSVPLRFNVINNEYHIDQEGAGKAWRSATLIKHTVLECGGGHVWDAELKEINE